MIPLEEDGKQLLYTSIVFMIVTTIAVALRLIAKQKTKSPFARDDFFTIFALIDFAAWNAVIISSVVDIGGTYNPLKFTNPLPQFAELYKYLWISELLLSWGITLVKVSILAFYGAIFTTPTFQLARRVVLALCLMWCIAMTFVVVFQCHPVKAAWDPLRTSKNQCLLFGSFVLGYEASNIAIDLAILCLPIYMIRRLQLPARRKWTLSFIFLLGGFVCVTGILRVVYSYNPKEPITGTFQYPLLQQPLTAALVPSLSLGIVWSTVELGTAIICGCLPTYGPLLHDTNLPAPIRAWFASARCGPQSTSSAGRQHLSRTTYGDSVVTGGYKKFNDDTLSDDDDGQLNDANSGPWTEMARIEQETPQGQGGGRRVEVV